MIALTAACVLVTLAAVSVVGVVLRFAKEQRAFVLAVLKHLHPEVSTAPGPAAALSEPPPDPRVEAHAKVLQARAEAIVAEEAAGHPGFIAEGRAAMRLAGLDPDDAAQVVGFNARYEGNA